MSWVAAAVIGSSLIGGAIQSGAAKDAASQAAGASNHATDVQQHMFDVTNAQSAPWRQAGASALRDIGIGFSGPTVAAAAVQNPTDPAATAWRQSQIQANPGGFMDTGPDGVQFLNTTGADPAGTPTAGTQSGSQPASSIGQGQFTHTFGPEDLKTNLAPNYDWQLGQGLGAMQNSAAGTTGLISGNAIRGLNDYAQNFAGNSYQNAFNNYNTQQSNIFNRLSTIAGMGNASAMNSGNVGAQTGAGMAGSIMNAGNAAAAGTIGSARAISGGLNNAAGSWYGMNYLDNQSGSNPMTYIERPA